MKWSRTWAGRSSNGGLLFRISKTMRSFVSLKFVQRLSGRKMNADISAAERHVQGDSAANS